MPTYTLLAIVTAVVGVIAVWRLIELVRAPSPTRNRIFVFVLFASSFVSNASEIPQVQVEINSVADGLAGLISFVSLLGFFAGFVVFFGAASPDSWFGAVRVQLATALTVALALVGAWLASIGSGSSLQYVDLPTSSPVGPILFSLVSNLYLAYACIACAYLAGLESSRGSRTGRLAFSLCAFGMVLCFIGGPLIRVPATVLVWTSTAMGPGQGGHAILIASQGTPAVPVLGSGIILVAVGLILVALRTLIGKTQLWVRAKSDSLVLLLLWRDLVAAFPEIAEFPRDGRLRIALRLREVRYRHQRKLIECADGLWRLSPYVDDPDDSDADSVLPIETQAALVRDALARFHRGDQPLAEPVAIAAPLDGDSERALLALARAYARLRSNAPSPRPSSATV